MDTHSIFSRRAVLKASPIVAVGILTSEAMAFGVDADTTAAVDPTLAAMSHLKDCDRALDKAYDALTSAEEKAKPVLGWRPFRLIAWRRYSAIGGSEIAKARDEFLRAGYPANLINAEYADALNRYRDTEVAGTAWDRKAGVVALRRANEKALRAYRSALWKLAKTTPTTLDGAAVMAAWLAKELVDWDEDYFPVAAKSLARGLRKIAQGGAQ